MAGTPIENRVYQTLFFGSGSPENIIADFGIEYTDVAARIRYKQTNLPYGKAWTVVAVNVLPDVIVGWNKVTGTPTTVQGYGITNALIKENNLSDVENAATSRANLGATTIGNNFFILPNPGAETFIRINADNTISLLSAAAFLAAIGGGSGSDDAVAMSITLGGII